MADFVTGLLGIVLMITYILLMVVKLNELALWVVSLVGIALAIWAFWGDAGAPLLRGKPPQNGTS
jgi:cobalamin synthase